MVISNKVRSNKLDCAHCTINFVFYNEYIVYIIIYIIPGKKLRFIFLTKKRKTASSLEAQLKTARSTARNALQREKSFKKGVEYGLKVSREARD